MIDNLESRYDCAYSGQDLHELQHDLDALLSSNEPSTKEKEDRIHRLENQIRFIKNKCDIRP